MLVAIDNRQVIRFGGVEDDVADGAAWHMAIETLVSHRRRQSIVFAAVIRFVALHARSRLRSCCLLDMGIVARDAGHLAVLKTGGLTHVLCLIRRVLEFCVLRGVRRKIIGKYFSGRVRKGRRVASIGFGVALRADFNLALSRELARLHDKVGIRCFGVGLVILDMLLPWTVTPFARDSQDEVVLRIRV